jgi:predicted dehydrogenase
MGIRILIVGLGSIGKRHARLLRQHFPHEVVALRSFLGQETNDLGIPEVSSWEEVDSQTFDVAVIANPTNMHIETALRCAERGLHLFIEKPIDCRLAGLEDLIRIVGERQLTAYVAYPLRFHPVVRGLKERLRERNVLHAGMVCASFLPDWRPSQDHRKVYSSSTEQGGGIFLDMSHELDLAEYLFGPVLEIQGKLSRMSELTVDSDDCADLLVTHESVMTNIHLNMFSREPRRFVEIDTSDGYMCADVRGQIISDFTRGAKEEERFSIDGDHIYLEQLRYFFDNIGRQDMDNTLLLASGLYKKMIEFREEQGYGSADYHLCPGRVAGSQG